MITEFYTLFSKINQIIITIIGTLIAFVAPIYSLIILVLLAIIFDTVIGIWRSKKLQKEITSKALSAIAGKLFLYEGALILFWLVDLWIVGDFVGLAINIPFVLTKLIAITLVWIEIKSIDENIKEVKGISLFKKMKELISRVKSIKNDLEELK